MLKGRGGFVGHNKRNGQDGRAGVGQGMVLRATELASTAQCKCCFSMLSAYLGPRTSSELAHYLSPGKPMLSRHFWVAARGLCSTPLTVLPSTSSPRSRCACCLQCLCSIESPVWVGVLYHAHLLATQVHACTKTLCPRLNYHSHRRRRWRTPSLLCVLSSSTRARCLCLAPSEFVSSTHV